MGRLRRGASDLVNASIGQDKIRLRFAGEIVFGRDINEILDTNKGCPKRRDKPTLKESLPIIVRRLFPPTSIDQLSIDEFQIQIGPVKQSQIFTGPDLARNNSFGSTHRSILVCS